MSSLSIFKRAVLAVAVLGMAALGVRAEETADDEEIDEFEMSVTENLATPVIPGKSKALVSAFMQRLYQSFNSKEYTTNMLRNNEVIHVVMPCSTLFGANDIELKASGKTQLAAFRQVVANPTLYKVLVAVHTDNTGDEMYADSITEARATAIDQYMYELSGGVDTGVIPYGIGRDEQVTDNSTMEARSKNRRVEFYVVPTLALVDKLRTTK
jgi:outer membrane protein OmpA-like peptidoglycan-associated protein